MSLLKKLTISTLLLGLSLGLAGCGGQEKKQSEEIPTLTYYDVGTPQEGTEEVVKAINEYLDKKEAGYHINLQFFDWGEYEQRLQLASNAGDDWDIAFTANWSGPYKNLAEKGAFADITDLINEKGKDIKDSLSEDVIKGASINGRL
ncbi:extracellular solute-binding protein [Anaerococcus sp. Marseille-P3915]|uniref:extracellular solute-binding protein n=1 Tax=Anaerococcus sp. Marseille-P3915 TaxID=2057799 RepID=UPI001F4706DD|nr:extracellular solute-binding protein [Anaerococcus sp. Marseille-P3915]